MILLKKKIKELNEYQLVIIDKLIKIIQLGRNDFPAEHLNIIENILSDDNIDCHWNII